VQHPLPRLGVEVGQVAEAAGGQEVALEVFDPGLDDALLLWVVRRAGVDLEAVAFGAFGVGTLHQRVVAAGLDDGALGVVDDDALGHAVEPLEGAPVAAQPGGTALVPDELDVLVAAVAQRHDEGPGAPRFAVGVGQHRAGAEVDLRGLGRGEAQAHGDLWRHLTAQLAQHAHDGRVAARVGVLAPERGVDGAALHASVQPGLDGRAVRLDAGDGGAGTPARAERGDDGLVVGNVGAGVQPALRHSDGAQLAELVAAHQA
jgi:hypothetical protein